MKKIWITCDQRFSKWGYIQKRIIVDKNGRIFFPWDLFDYKELDEIVLDNFLHYLTVNEARSVLLESFKTLKVKGKLVVKMPDINCCFGKKQICLSCNDDVDMKSDFERNFCSTYDRKKLRSLLEKIGFVVELIGSDDGDIVVEAFKKSSGGERQEGKSIDDIRLDHIERYLFASKLISKPDCIVTDAASGVGYGAFLLSKNNYVKFVQAVDLSAEAIEHAKRYFFSEKVRYFCADLEKDDVWDTIEMSDYFVSFETIEHLKNPGSFLRKVYNNLKVNGVLIGSTPNEKVMPFDREVFLFHFKHYTVFELYDLLSKVGFRNVLFFYQSRKIPSRISSIDEGEYIIFVAYK